MGSDEAEAEEEGYSSGVVGAALLEEVGWREDLTASHSLCCCLSPGQATAIGWRGYRVAVAESRDGEK